MVVRVVVASVNRADLDGIEPRPQFTRLFLGLRAPRNHRVGIDVAGVVDAVGDGVTRFKPGDAVFADLYPFGQGSFAEFASAPERAFLPIPTGMSFETAATLPHSATLAIQGLRRRDGRTVGPGDSVLIDGASGNVGPFAIQIAKALGAVVTATCSPGKVDFVRSLGADHVLDYTDGRLHEGRRALRLDPRHGLAPSAPPMPPRAQARWHLRHARRDGVADRRVDRRSGRCSRWSATASPA